MKQIKTDEFHRGLIVAEDARSLLWTRREILQRLLHDGIRLDVAVPLDKYQHHLREMGCTIVGLNLQRRGMNPIADLALVRQLSSIVRAKPYSFALCYSIKPNIYGGYCLRRANIPFYLNVTGMGSAMNRPGVLRALVCWMYRHVAPYASRIFFENEDNCRRFCEWRLCRREQTVVFPGAGINLQHYTPLPYPDDSKEIHLLYVGRLMVDKGITELLQATACFQQDMPQVHVHLLGMCEQDFLPVLNQYGQLPNLHIHDFAEDIRPFVRDCHAVILPSYHEGMANVLLEGGSLGRPLLTSRIPGCQEAVKEGRNGYLFAPRNVEQLSSAVRRFVQLSPKERRTMAYESRQIIESVFDRANIVERITAIIGEQLNVHER